LPQRDRHAVRIGELWQVEPARRRIEHKKTHRVFIVHRFDLAGLADEAFLGRFLHADHVPITVGGVGGEGAFAGVEQTGVEGVTPSPEVLLHPPRERQQTPAALDAPHHFVEHPFVRLRFHVGSFPWLC